jgi:hypothetical protein
LPDQVGSDPSREIEMSKTVADMTTDELKEMLGELIEAKLAEVLGDPDEGLELRDTMRQRLELQRSAVGGGDRGEPFDDVARRLDLS